jgi:hypothetical protein
MERSDGSRRPIGQACDTRVGKIGEGPGLEREKRMSVGQSRGENNARSQDEQYIFVYLKKFKRLELIQSKVVLPIFEIF